MKLSDKQIRLALQVLYDNWVWVDDSPLLMHLLLNGWVIQVPSRLGFRTTLSDAGRAKLKEIEDENRS